MNTTIKSEIEAINKQTEIIKKIRLEMANKFETLSKFEEDKPNV